MGGKHFSLCTKYGTKEFTQKFQVLTERDTNMWQIMRWKDTTQVLDCKRDSTTILAFPYKYLEFLSKLFCSILCTYAEVFSTHVPQTFMCNPSATGVNLFKHQIGSFTANTEGCTVNSFPPAFIHMGPWDTTNTNIFISVNICYGWFNIWKSNLAQMRL